MPVYESQRNRMNGVKAIKHHQSQVHVPRQDGVGGAGRGRGRNVGGGRNGGRH